MSAAGPTLPAPNSRQAEEIEVTVALFADNPEVELLTWRVIDPISLLREGEQAGGIYVEFLYRHVDGDPHPLPGREVTVFGDDGTVLDSHDFG
jgi:hypothetical protein